MPRRPASHDLVTLLVAVVAALALSACGEDAGRKRSVALGECRLPHLSTAVKCATIEVPEDRDRPDGRKIGIFAAILPANTVNPKDDPLVILAGGPGQAASTLATFASRLTELRRTRDVVLIDQRGTGRSSALSCEAFKPRDDDVFEPDPVPRARACVDELKAKGVDLAQYTTAAWIADLEAMRAALGYEKWNLWGGSYGTRVAQEYLRRHPGRVRTMTLDGVAPPGMIITVDVWKTREAALDAIIGACAASAPCRASHPDVAQTLRDIERDLGPAGREIEIVDPRTGKSRRERITFDVIVAALQPLTYAPETAVLLPEMLALAAKGDLAPLFAANPMASGRDDEQLNAALHFSVTCAEDVPRIDDASRAILEPLRSRRLATQTIAVCGVWPRGKVAADFAQPVTSDVPTLLFSGGMDPVTPPAYGDAVAKSLSQSRHIVAPGYGHIVSVHACGPRMIAAFVEAARSDAAPQACVSYFEKSTPPPMWPNRLAPAS